MTDYKASKRIVGTSAERTGTTYDSGSITGQGNWETSGSGGTLTFTSGINVASSSEFTHMPYFDLQNSAYLGSGNYLSETAWVMRWKMTFSAYPNNYGTPFMTVSSTTGLRNASQNYVASRFDGGSIGIQGKIGATVDGGSTAQSMTESTYESTTFYFQLKRDGTDVYMANYTDDTYGTVDWTSSAKAITGSGDMDLRYIKFIPWYEGNDGGDYNTTMNNFKLYNGTTDPSTVGVSNAQTYSIFSETDTGKDWIWSGSTWTEVA